MDFLKNKKIIAIAILCAVLLATGSAVWSNRSDGKTHIYFLNIGQGDAALIKTPTNELILVDGGPGNRVLSELGKNLPFWRRDFDLVIMTHPDKDHIEGLATVIDQYHIRRFLMNGAFQKNAVVQAILRKLVERQVPVLLAEEDHDFEFGNVKLDMLFPFEPTLGQTDFTNSTSIVFRLISPRGTALFTGDADEFVERKILEAGREIRSDVLKVGHHGSKYSSSQAFLEAVRPRIAIISVGKNRYGHPTPEVLDRLQKIGAEIHRTDREGTIEIIF